MNNDDKELTLEQEIVRDCPILFKMRNGPMTDTCMCWGFSCGKGWHSIIGDAAREMEVLNSLFYPKYRVRIQADQIKEKFGTLRFYYSVVKDPNVLFTWIGNRFAQLADYLSDWRRFNYETKQVYDIEPYDYDEVKELTKEEYEDCLNERVKCINVEYSVKDGKYLKTIHLRNYGKQHSEPTKLKALWKAKEICNKLRWLFLCKMPKKDNSKVRNAIYYLDAKARDIVKNAEHSCENVCEDCGMTIGTDWSPTCRMTGWINYLCEDCAKKRTGTYVKNEELWQNGKMLKSKEELNKKYSEIAH